jgi:hypothetical protein
MERRAATVVPVAPAVRQSLAAPESVVPAVMPVPVVTEAPRLLALPTVSVAMAARVVPAASAALRSRALMATVVPVA